jgi:hypothetical protein
MAIKLNPLNKFTAYENHVVPIAVVLLVALVGTILLTVSHAATPYGSVSATQGTLGGNATTGSCTGATESSCVVFGKGATTTTTTTSSSGMISGVYAGNPTECTDDSGPSCEAGVDNFVSTTGDHVSLAGAALPWGSGTGAGAYVAGAGCHDNSVYGWAYLTIPDCIDSWLGSFKGTSYQMVIDLPMIGTDASNTDENTLAEGAAGDENATFVTIAQNLVALGFGNAMIRPGWEFDGNWYPWSVASDSDATTYATYYQNIVTAMKSVSGANFKFIWSPTGGQNTSWNISDAYPGAGYVNYISEDIYDQSYSSTIFPPDGDTNNTSTVAQSQAVWNQYLTQPQGLDWLASYSQTTGKPILITEWADVISSSGGSWPDHGLGDDPTFINNMYNWLKTNNAGGIYFNYCSVGGCSTTSGDNFSITSGAFPNALAAYKTDFGSTQ